MGKNYHVIVNEKPICYSTIPCVLAKSTTTKREIPAKPQQRTHVSQQYWALRVIMPGWTMSGKTRKQCNWQCYWIYMTKTLKANRDLIQSAVIIHVECGKLNLRNPPRQWSCEMHKVAQQDIEQHCFFFFSAFEREFPGLCLRSLFKRQCKF